MMKIYSTKNLIVNTTDSETDHAELERDKEMERLKEFKEFDIHKILRDQLNRKKRLAKEKESNVTGEEDKVGMLHFRRLFHV